MRPRPKTALLAAVLAAVLVAACIAPRPGVSAQPAPGGPTVVTSTSVFADMVQQVGGTRVTSVRSIVPAGVDVEDYEPTPDDLRAVSQANLLVMNGLALDRWVPRMVQSANPTITTLVLSDGLPVLGVGTSDDADIAQNGNPHFWLDPTYAKTYAQRIHDQLVQLDPDGASIYDANTTAYLAQLDDLDSWIQQLVATIPPDNRKLVTSHEAFPYFAARYGFQVIGVITPSPGQDPSAGELAQLVETVRNAHVRAVFSEAQFSPKLSETLAQEAGVQEVVTDVYSDSLGNPPADSYLGMMRHNVARIVQALA